MHILLVEDDAAITAGLQYSLSREGYQVTAADCVQAALEQLQHDTAFQLAVIDLRLPDGDGFTVCEKAKQKDLPIIFLTADDNEMSIVKGLDMGGDDYIVKPFRLQELLSRIRSVLRRYECCVNKRNLQIQDLTIDLKQAKVFRGQDEIYLSAMEYQLLLIFARHPGQTITRTRLMDLLWDNKGCYVEDNTLSVTIRRIREKIEHDPQDPKILTTVRGLGYRMEKAHES